MSAVAKPVVWITRPQPGADKSAAAIAEMGFEPVVVPLTEVTATDPAIDPAEAARADAVVVTSGNAVRLAPDMFVTALRDKTVYTVGAATKADALARGFRDVHSADGAVDDLVALVSAREKPGSVLVYLCGRRRTGDLEGKLARTGMNCLVCEVYSTKIVSQMTDILEKKLAAGSPDAVLFHSALSARAFSEHAKAQSPQAYVNTRFLTISERVSKALPGRVQDRISVAEEPTEQSLLAALCDILSAGKG